MSDLIDRQAAIEEETISTPTWSGTFELHHPLTEEEWDIIRDVDFDYTTRIHFITKHGKSVDFVKETASRWIPVSERLPEGGHNIIFCDYKGNVCEGVYHAIIGQWVGFRWNSIYHHDAVMAWMPLPDPYKEEE